jgi:hypothetical protein
VDAESLGLLAARRLADLETEIGSGLTEAEFARIEAGYGFTFADDHRAFLAAGLPLGNKWPNWRTPSDALDDQIRWPIDGLLFDVAHNDFWYPAWGERPAEVADAIAVADDWIASAPRMVPVYGHRYLPAGAGTYGHPVLSMYQTDIIVYGADLADYMNQEFSRAPSPAGSQVTVAFWRDLVY